MPACDAIWSAVATIADAPRVDPTGAAGSATDLTLRPPYAGRVIVRRTVPNAVPLAAASIGALATVIGSLSPWVASGSVDRSSYEIIHLVDRLGFAEDGPFGIALRAGPLMPLFVSPARSRCGGAVISSARRWR